MLKLESKAYKNLHLEKYMKTVIILTFLSNYMALDLNQNKLMTHLKKNETINRSHHNIRSQILKSIRDHIWVFKKPMSWNCTEMIDNSKIWATKRKISYILLGENKLFHKSHSLCLIKRSDNFKSTQFARFMSFAVNMNKTKQ